MTNAEDRNWPYVVINLALFTLATILMDFVGQNNKVFVLAGFIILMLVAATIRFRRNPEWRKKVQSWHTILPAALCLLLFLWFMIFMSPDRAA